MQGANLLVIPLGLEPKTYCLEGSCSIQLSYGTIESGCKSSVFCADFQIICGFFASIHKNPSESNAKQPLKEQVFTAG